jgi:stage IV sporulation protein FB
MLAVPEPTSFDLRWRMFGTDIRVHPLFWVITAVLGWSNFERGQFPGLLLWIACVFVSILVHEFGHVMMGRLFGSRGYIVLYSFGGLAVGSHTGVRWQRILISFAGPAAQFLLLGLVLVVETMVIRPGEPPDPRDFRDQWNPQVETFRMLWFINLWWPILNLLPIWPLDGGQIMREVCEGVSRDNGTRASLIISGCVAAVLAVHVLMCAQGKPLIPWLPFYPSMFMAIFFALFAIESFQALQTIQRRPPRYRDEDDDRLPWEREEKQPWER